MRLLSAVLLPMLLGQAACSGATDSLGHVAPPGGGDPPNIVLAIADDLDPDHLGFCGNALARTPNLDRLAREGAYFPTLHVQPVCRAAHATLLTGRWPHETGIVNNRVEKRLDPAGVMPRLLAQRGYATYCAGKLWEGEPEAYGFTAPAANDKDFGRKGEAGRADLFRFLEQHAESGPWFVWWAPNLPHVPHEPPERFARAFAETEVEPPAGFRGDPADFARAERACLAMESWLDDELGQLLAKLDELGERDETLIVFLADNGWSTARPAKGTPREKGVRAPLVVSPPEKMAPPGKLASARPSVEGVRRLVDLVDVHATLLDYAGLALPPGARGQSLRPLLEGGECARRERVCGAFFTRHGIADVGGELGGLYARDERWKYVLYLREVDSASLSAGASLAPPFHHLAGTEELFDLVADPLEEHDLAGGEDQSGRLRDFRTGARAWWEGSGGKPLELPPGTER